MPIHATLFRYIARQFLLRFAAALAILLGLILLLEAVELLRRAAERPEIGFGLIAEMSVLKLAETGQEVFPFAILFSAMYTFWRMTRTQELVVVRAAGVSAWQFLGPVVAGALAIGVLATTVVNPIASAMAARFERLEDRHFRGRTTSLDLSGSGLWLRQADSSGEALVHVQSVEIAERLFRSAMFLLYRDGVYFGRIDADEAALVPGRWELRNARLSFVGQTTTFAPRHELPTDLSLDQIEESFASPETLSFWELPRFIAELEATGFSAVRHRLHFQSQLARPALFCAMVLFAAAFSLRQTRRGGTPQLIAAGVLSGLFVYVLGDVVEAFGLSQTIPVLLAAWTPATVSLMLGAAALLHLEDG